LLIFFITLTLPAGLSAEPRIGTWKTPQTIQPFFYEKFLPPEKKPKIFTFTNPADQKSALLAGSLDLCGTTIVHAIHSASRGEPVVVVAAMCNRSSALVVRKDGGITKVTDLKGKRIGYVPGTMHEILLRETLIRSGLSPERDVVMMRVDFFDMGTALARGAIDAFLSGEPLPAVSEAEGYGRIIAFPYYEDAFGTINAGLLARRKSVAENPGLIRDLVKAHAEATRYLNRNREEWLLRAAEFGTPIEVVRSAAANIELAWEMDARFVRRAEALGERMQALGMIDRQPDYGMLFDLDFVRAAREQMGEAREAR
jgi:NitT/TauT family transport system substrate-binding protein